MAKNHTPQQKEFLRELADPANKGDIRKCMTAAGYHEKANMDHLISGLKSEILDIAERVLAAHAVQASMAMAGVISDDVLAPDVKERMAAMREVMDRAGVIKKDGMKLGDGQGAAIVFLPAKDTPKDDE